MLYHSCNCFMHSATVHRFTLRGCNRIFMLRCFGCFWCFSCYCYFLAIASELIGIASVTIVVSRSVTGFEIFAWVAMLLVLQVLAYVPIVTSKSERKWVSLIYIEEERDQYLKLALGPPCLWSVSDFIFLASAYEGGWPILSLTVSSSRWQRTVSVFIIHVAELAGVQVEYKALTKVLPWTGFEPLTLTSREPCTSLIYITEDKKLTLENE